MDADPPTDPPTPELPVPVDPEFDPTTEPPLPLDPVAALAP
jgi:hypothetical protein